MIRTPARLRVRAVSALALMLSLPLAAQEQSGGFSLPEPTPTPTPAPQGPADERAGVAIPPRSAPAPRIEPAPVLTPEASPAPRPAPLRLPQPVPSQNAGPATAPATPSPPAPTPSPEAAPETAPTPDPVTLPSGSPLPQPSIDVLPDREGPPEDTFGESPILWSQWWPYAAGALGALALLGGAALLWRRRKPKPLRLAAQPPGTGADPSAPDHAAPLLALDLALDVTGATRSVMMFTLQYRLTLANRTGRAVNDLNLAVQLACARRGAGNAASPGAAQRLERIERIGPHQSRSITGEVQLPLSEIAPLHQGKLPLFIPLLQVTLEGEGQSALARSFVIGTPSAGGTGRLHPIPLDKPPGSITGLRAQRIEVPTVSAAA